MAIPSFTNLQLEIDANIAVLSVHRPQALNALNEATLRELKQAFDYIEGCVPNGANPERVDVVVFTGSGEKAFIAGADILEMKDKDPKAGEAFARLGQSVTYQMEHLTQPVIAAVNGYALGGGCEFAIACDFILASPNAVFGQPEVQLGIMPGFGGCVRLAKFVGVPRAKELIYTGRKFSAEEAKVMGLVQEVVESSKLLARAKEIALAITKVSPLAVGRSKRTINHVQHQAMDAALGEEALVFGSLFGSHDQREGMNAFAEKRKPEFRGE